MAIVGMNGAGGIPPAPEAQLQALAQRLLRDAGGLSPEDRLVLEGIAASPTVSQDAERAFAGQLTFGQRVADRVATFGGSWTFIGLFAAILVSWVLLNSEVLVHWHAAFDPYPYILLNLFLSMLAAIQAPVIMMSQNRQTAKDRLEARLDYEVNLKAELEVADLRARMARVEQLLERLLAARGIADRD